MKNGTLSSPNFNLDASYTYPAFSDCLWTITAPKGFAVSLKFIFFDVLTGKSGHCDEDFVDILDGADSNARRIGQLTLTEYDNHCICNVFDSLAKILFFKTSLNIFYSSIGLVLAVRGNIMNESKLLCHNLCKLCSSYTEFVPPRNSVPLYCANL